MLDFDFLSFHCLFPLMEFTDYGLDMPAVGCPFHSACDDS